jgi:hypothetical protein
MKTQILATLLLAGLVAGCATPYRPGNLEKNLTVNLSLDDGSVLTRSGAAIGVHNVGKDCEADYLGYVDLVTGANEIGIAPGQRTLLIVEVEQRSVGSRSSMQRGAAFTPKPGAKYRIDANYVDAMFDFRLYEVTRAGKRELPVGNDC